MKTRMATRTLSFILSGVSAVALLLGLTTLSACDDDNTSIQEFKSAGLTTTTEMRLFLEKRGFTVVERRPLIAKPGVWIPINEYVAVNDIRWMKQREREILVYASDDILKGRVTAKSVRKIVISGDGLQNVLVISGKDVRPLQQANENAGGQNAILLVVFTPEVLYVANLRNKVLLLYHRMPI